MRLGDWGSPGFLGFFLTTRFPLPLFGDAGTGEVLEASCSFSVIEAGLLPLEEVLSPVLGLRFLTSAPLGRIPSISPSSLE